MKTIHLYLIAMAATLAACSSNELADPAGDDVGDVDISFTSVVADAASRGSSVDIAALQSTGFWVKALKIDGSSLWRNSATGDMLHFKYDTSTSKFVPDVDDSKTFITTWPTGQTIFLYATNIDPTVMPITKNNATNNTYDGAVYSSVTMNEDVTKHTDFVHASNYGRRSDFSGGTVPLHFRHAYTQVEIQAKNDNTAYTVKVKGYKMCYKNINGKFWFLNPTQYKTAADLKTAMDALDAAAAEAEAEGSTATHDENKALVTYAKRHWSFNNGEEGGSSLFTMSSGYKNGFNTTANSIFDTDDANHFTLNGTAQTISNGTDNGDMMIIPWTVTGYNGTSGAYIALLVQVDYNNAKNATKIPLYPALVTENSTKRVSYTGLPKHYGWIYVPYTFDDAWKNYIGKKVTFVLDFTSGLGRVDMNKPETVDTETGYNEADGTGTGGTVEDPYAAKDLVLDTNNIVVTTSVTAWDVSTAATTMPNPNN